MVTEPDRPDFVQSEGVFFFAHVLRRLSDGIVEGCAAWYADMGLEAPPRTASTLHLLHRCGPQSVTEVASALRQSHPLAIQWIKQLAELGLVQTMKDGSDRRRTIVSLTADGAAQADRLIAAHEAFERAYRELAHEVDADPFEALWRMDEALRKQGFADRLRKAQKA